MDTTGAHDDDTLTALYQQFATAIDPIITQTDDGKWRAQYPGLDWHVLADTEHEAGEEISKEAMRRIDAGRSDGQPPHDLLQRHLQHPIPGVYAMDRELFVYLRTEVGAAETQRAFEEAERRRAQGRSYTKADYLRDQASRDNP